MELKFLVELKNINNLKKFITLNNKKIIIINKIIVK
jgi:hypothetical protein